MNSCAGGAAYLNCALQPGLSLVKFCFMQLSTRLTFGMALEQSLKARGRPVGGDDDERPVRVVRLEHGGLQVGHGRARRRDDRADRRPGQPDAERGERGDPLVVPDVTL